MSRWIISIFISLGIHALVLSLNTDWFNIMPSPRPSPHLTTISLIALPPRGEKQAISTEKPSGKTEKKAPALSPRKPSPPKPVVRQMPQKPNKQNISPVKPDPPQKALETQAAVREDVPEVKVKPKKKTSQQDIAPVKPDSLERTLEKQTPVREEVPKIKIKPKISLKKMTKKPLKAGQAEIAQKVDPAETPELRSKLKPFDEPAVDLKPEKSISAPSETPAPVPSQNIPGKDAVNESSTGKQSTAVATRGGPSTESALVMARPLYRKNPPPRYPRRARKKGYEGIVILEVLVDRKGLVKDMNVFKSSGYAILDQSALKSVKKWVFEPGTRNGKAIDMRIRVPIRFKLN